MDDYLPRLTQKTPILMGWVSASLLMGCAFLHMSPPRITDASPTGRVAPGEPPAITLTFSAPMDHTAVEGAFSLLIEGRTQPGLFRWPKEEVMVFTPRGGTGEPPRSHWLGEISLTSAAEDIWGNNLAEDFHRNINSRTPGDVITLEEISPAADALPAGERRALVLRFSQPGDRDSFYRAWSLTPEKEGLWEWGPEDREVRFIPHQPWTAGRRISWNLAESFRSADGAPLESERRGSFLPGGPSEPPILRRVTFVGPAPAGGGTAPRWELEGEGSPVTAPPPEIASRGSFEIAFDQKLEEFSCSPWGGSSLPAGLRLEPPTAASLAWISGGEGSVLRITLEEDWPWQAPGALEVFPEGGIWRNAQGRELRRGDRFPFTVGWEGSRPPRIAEARLDGVLLEEGVPLSMAAYSEAPAEGTLTFTLDCRPGSAGGDPVSLWENLSFRSSNGRITAVPLGFRLEDNRFITQWRWEIFDTSMAVVEMMPGWTDQEGCACPDKWRLAFPADPAE